MDFKQFFKVFLMAFLALVLVAGHNACGDDGRLKFWRG